MIVAVSSLNGGYDSSVGGEGNLDLEMEVFEFMQQSGKPDAFPTRRDLVSAGRPDLAKAIAEEGGWLAAGWDEEGGEEEGAEMGFEGLSSDVSFATDEKGTAAAAVVEVEEKGRSRPKLSRRKYKARSLKRNSSSSSAAEGKSSRVRIGERSGGIAERRLNGANVVREVENAVDDNDARWVVTSHLRLIIRKRQFQFLKENARVFLGHDNYTPTVPFTVSIWYMFFYLLRKSL